MIDRERQAKITARHRRGESYLEILQSMQRGIRVPIGTVKDEIDEIRESPWASDFSRKYGGLVALWEDQKGFPWIFLE